MVRKQTSSNMEPEPNSSKHIPIKRLKATSFSSTEKCMVINMYEHLKKTWPPEHKRYMKTNLAKRTAYTLGIGTASVYRILKNYKYNGRPTSPIQTKNRPNICDKINERNKAEIFKKVHGLFLNGELPSLNKVLQAVNEDESLPKLKRSSLYRLMKHMKLDFNKSTIKKTKKQSTELKTHPFKNYKINYKTNEYFMPEHTS